MFKKRRLTTKYTYRAVARVKIMIKVKKVTPPGVESHGKF